MKNTAPGLLGADVHGELTGDYVEQSALHMRAVGKMVRRVLGVPHPDFPPPAPLDRAEANPRRGKLNPGASQSTSLAKRVKLNDGNDVSNFILQGHKPAPPSEPPSLDLRIARSLELFRERASGSCDITKLQDIYNTMSDDTDILADNLTSEC